MKRITIYTALILLLVIGSVYGGPPIPLAGSGHKPNVIEQLDSNVTVTDTGTGSIVTTVDGVVVSTATASGIAATITSGAVSLTSLAVPSGLTATTAGAQASALTATTLNVTGDSVRVSTTQTPAGSDACSAGELAWDATYLYVCTASSAWKRLTLTSY